MRLGFRLVCSGCGKAHAPDTLAWRCECGSPLDVEKPLPAEPRFEGRGVWRYRPLLPLLDDRCVVTLGEGSTPTVERDLYGVEALLKLEYLNPTGSFKDRGATVMVSNLKAAGAREIAIDSSGNAGCAVAAYASAAGIRCRVYVPTGAPRAKKMQIALYGAELVEVPGPRSEVGKRLLAELKPGVAYASHMWNPYFIEGLKTIAYEVAERFGAPDAAVLPVGSGGLLLGVHRGFAEVARLGFAERVPRIVAVQAAGYTPVYDALYGPYGAEPPAEPLADGIAIPNPPRLKQVVEAVRESGGGAVVVEDREIAEALKLLARAGLLVEPTSAAAVAGLRKAVEQGLVERGERVLVPLTGSGLKALDKIAGAIGEAPRHLEGGANAAEVGAGAG
jgi:threonine synthase